MITVDTEASKELIKSAKEIFERFGSTRLLGYGMLTIAVVLVLRSTDKPDPELLLWALAAVVVGFLILALSYIFRPHDPKPRLPKVTDEAHQ